MSETLEFLKRLHNMAVQQGHNPSKEFEYNTSIRCLNPDHEDNNPSMMVYKDKAQCFSCGYTIPNAVKAKPYKEKVNDIIIKKVIELTKEYTPKDFIEKRKYNLNICKQLNIGYLGVEVFNELLSLFGIKALQKAGLVNSKKKCFFINP